MTRGGDGADPGVGQPAAERRTRAGTVATAKATDGSRRNASLSPRWCQPRITQVVGRLVQLPVADAPEGVAERAVDDADGEGLVVPEALRRRAGAGRARRRRRWPRRPRRRASGRSGRDRSVVAPCPAPRSCRSARPGGAVYGGGRRGLGRGRRPARRPAGRLAPAGPARAPRPRRRAGSARPAGRWLKTDLFEEGLPDRALLPSLPSAPVGRHRRRRPRPSAPCPRRRCRAAVVADVRALPFRAGAVRRRAVDLDPRPLRRRRRHRPVAGRAARVLRARRAAGAHPRQRRQPADPGPQRPAPRAWPRRTGLVPFAVGATLDEAGGRRALADAGLRRRRHRPPPARPARRRHPPRPLRAGGSARVLPRFAALAGTRLAPCTGHFVAFLARLASTSLARSTARRRNSGEAGGEQRGARRRG